jgi:hypothetical protein
MGLIDLLLACSTGFNLLVPIGFVIRTVKDLSLRTRRKRVEHELPITCCNRYSLGISTSWPADAGAYEFMK